MKQLKVAPRKRRKKAIMKKRWIIKPGRSGWGRVKRREYLQYLISVRDEEHQARMLGLKIEAKSIEVVRAEFEKQFGSIYINNNNYEETEL